MQKRSATEVYHLPPLCGVLLLLQEESKPVAQKTSIPAVQTASEPTATEAPAVVPETTDSIVSQPVLLAPKVHIYPTSNAVSINVSITQSV